MIDRTRRGEELREEFKVLGSTGNVGIRGLNPVLFIY